MYKHLSLHFQFASQESKIIATPASAERVQKCVFNFEIYCFLKKTTNLPHLPYVPGVQKTDTIVFVYK